MNIDRVKSITLTFYLIFAIIISRLFFIQIISHDKLSRLVLKQTYKTVEISPKRGNILDSQGNSIAYNKTYFLASLYKPDIEDLPKTISSLITSTSNLPTDDINLLKKFESNQSQKWITLKHLFPESATSNPDYKDITFQVQDQRQYFNPQMYEIITSGLERYYQKLLSGRYGFSYQNQDALGNIIMSDKNWMLNPVDGVNLHTTINPIIQYHAYEILQKNIPKFEAKSGSIIVMQPSTGNIIAMVSLDNTPSSSTKNKTITDLYEPGSIFKPLIMASAIDNNSINLNWTCTQCDRPRTIGQYTIQNWDKNLHPDSTLQDIIKNSDNIGMSYVISALGQNSFLKYFSVLGLNRKTGIDLQGETKPINKSFWPDIDFATASFGQGFSLTQIQMISTFNVLANKGNYQNPSITINNQNPTINVFKPETIKEMNRILEYAVNNSPVSQLNTSKLSICAKSGTAQIASNGSYSDTQVVASYVGYFPCNEPKYTILVTLDRPQTSTWGSSTAAPIWYELALSINPLL